MKAVGGILIAVGVLIAGLSGLCSLSMLLEEATRPNAQVGDWLVIVGLVGGIPFLTGLALIYSGMKMLKETPRP